ncbi:hypothetical protein [Fangia hongkongensis]|uniref:hypothetical protein n=1 Tax=Fangia hongkongensis TaxID=270495 RepID=UPI0003611E49|nr:hypothetical protein [Fangia hongkongensis]MBK2124857.1 hypothetical protein [Fangia hongkongensis]
MLKKRIIQNKNVMNITACIAAMALTLVVYALSYVAQHRIITANYIAISSLSLLLLVFIRATYLYFVTKLLSLQNHRNVNAALNINKYTARLIFINVLLIFLSLTNLMTIEVVYYIFWLLQLYLIVIILLMQPALTELIKTVILRQQKTQIEKAHAYVVEN